MAEVRGDTVGSHSLWWRDHFWAWFARVHGDAAVIIPGAAASSVEALFGAEFDAHAWEANGCGYPLLPGVSNMYDPDGFVCVAVLDAETLAAEQAAAEEDGW